MKTISASSIGCEYFVEVSSFRLPVGISGKATTPEAGDLIIPLYNEAEAYLLRKHGLRLGTRCYGATRILEATPAATQEA